MKNEAFINWIFHDDLLKRLCLLIIVVSIAMISGALIAIRFEAAFYILGVAGLLVYVLLAYLHPFADFVILVFFALTVWLSSIKVIGDVSVMVGLGLIFTTTWLSRLALKIAFFKHVHEYRVLLGFTVIMLSSTLLNLDGPAGLSAVTTYLQVVLLFVLVVNMATTPSRLHTLSGIIVSSSTLLSILVLSDQFGWLAPGLISQQTAGVGVGAGMETVTRTGGLWGDANFTAVQLTIALPFIVEWWPIASVWWKRVLLLGAAIAILVAFAFTFSIGGLLGLATILLIKAFRNSRRSILAKILRLTVLSAVALITLNVILPNLYVQRMLMKLDVISIAASTQNLELLLESGSGRGDTWQAAVQSIAQSPLLGHGPGNISFINVQHSMLHKTSDRLGAHNMFLTVGGDLGLAGLAIFTWLLMSSMLPVRRSLNSDPNNSSLQWIEKALFVALVAYTVQGLAIDIHSQKSLWVLMGMASALKRLSLQCAPARHGDYKHG